MKDYIQKVLLRYGHPVPTKRQLTPHYHIEINYGAKYQYVTELAYSPPLDDARVKHIQEIFGGLLLIASAVYNKLIVVLINIGTHKSARTKQTNKAIL